MCFSAISVDMPSMYVYKSVSKTRLLIIRRTTLSQQTNSHDLEPYHSPTTINKVDSNNILFTRNNVILDTVEKMTNNPFIFNDEDLEDYNILKNNKELATTYALLIIGCIAYIVISDFLNKDDK